MTKEQEESLEKLKRQILIGECEKNIGIPVFISDLKNILSMLKEKDKMIDINKWEDTDPRIHKNANCRYSDRRTAQDFMCELILNGMATCKYLVERSK